MEILFALLFLATIVATSLILYHAYKRDQALQSLLDEPTLLPPRKMGVATPKPPTFLSQAPIPPTPPTPPKLGKSKPTKTSRAKVYQELGHPSKWREESRRIAYLQPLLRGEASELASFEIPDSFPYPDDSSSSYNGFSSPTQESESFGSGGSSGGGGSSYSYEDSSSSSSSSYSPPVGASSSYDPPSYSSSSYDSSPSYSSSSSGSSSYDSSSYSSSSSYDSGSSSSSSSYDSSSSWLGR